MPIRVVLMGYKKQMQQRKPYSKVEIGIKCKYIKIKIDAQTQNIQTPHLIRDKRRES